MTFRTKLIQIAVVMIVIMGQTFYFTPQALATDHPGGLHSQIQISLTKQKIQQNLQPWKDAYDELIASANGYLSHSSQAVEVFFAPGYYDDPDGSTAAKTLIREDGVAAYTLAISYQLDESSNRTQYADKAVELLNSWATINKTVSGVDGPEYMCTGGIGLIHSADLVWNYDGWNPADRDNFTNWVNSVYQDAANVIIGFPRNLGSWGTMASISAAYLVGDQETIDTDIELIKNRIRDTIYSDGHITDAEYGAKGMWYTYYNLAPLTVACQVALNASGVDLFYYTSPNDRNIKTALDNLFYYTEHPDEWPYYEGELSMLPTIHSWPGNLFMAMAGVYNDDDYKNWVTSSGPVYDSTWWETTNHIGWYFPVLMQPLSVPDTTPPVRSDGQPTGALPAGTTEITISLTTDETATAKYATVPGTSYDSMPDTFSTTGGTAHATLVTGLSDGNTYTFYVRTNDTAGNQNTDDFIITFSVAPPADTTQPVISSVEATAITSSSATITWITDDLSDSTVNYGTTTSLGLTTSDPNLVTDHSISFYGLSNNTAYYFQVFSRNSDNYSSESSIDDFTTAPFTPPTTISLQIATGADDAVETARQAINTSGTLKVRSYPGATPYQRKSTGLRFQNVDIPQGAVVTASYISLYPNSTSSNDVNCTLYAEDTGDAADFVTNPHIINETFRPRTTASTSWIEDDVTVGTYVNSPSLNAPLQELFNRPDWAPGNSLAILMIAHEDVNKEVRFWEQEKYLNLPVELHIEFTTGSAIVTFPDANLEAVIRTAIGKPTGDIYDTDLLPLTSFDGNGKNITDLTGLEYCVNLTTLKLGINQISDITPLENLTSLTWLYLAENQISDISPLQGLTNLTHLFLGYNQIGDITPLENLPNLTNLYLSRIQIGDITPLQNLTSLEVINLQGNPVSDITPLQNLTNLKTLFLRDNQVSDISPLQNLTSLTWLVVADNQISDITPLQSLTSLTRLELYNNQISDITPLQNLTNITKLYCYRNQIDDISSLQNLTNITQLTLHTNQITDISPLVANAGIGSGDFIDLESNPLSPESLYIHVPALNDRGVTVSYYARPFTVTTNAASDITQNSATINGNLDSLGAHTSMDVSFEWGTESGVFSANTTPQALTAPGAFSADLSGLGPNTPYYYRAKATGVVTVYGEEESFTTGSAIVTFPDPNLEAVIRQAIGKPTGDIYPADLLPLTSLDGNNKNITDLTGLEYCVNLSDLVLNINQINDITPLQNLTSLTWLDLDSNQISDITPLQNHTSLQHLLLYINQVVDISPLIGLTNLSYLSLGGNQVVDVSPLSGLTNLQSLYLYTNQLVDILPLSGLTNLQVLGLHFNQISDVSPLVANAGIGNGDTVYLRGNPLSPESLYIHIPVLEDRGVTVDYDAQLLSVTTNAATDVTDTTVILHGNLDSLGGFSLANVSFEWGTESGVYTDNTTPEELTTPGPFSAMLSGLASETSYYFRAKAVGVVTVYGDEQIFNTDIVPIIYTFTMAVNGNGSTTPTVGLHDYPKGTVVDISALPDTGWQFDNWTGDVYDPNSAETIIIMDTDKPVTANFSLIPPTQTLSLQIATGADDAVETARQAISTSGTLKVRSYPGATPYQRKSTGLRFQNVDIPQGAVVTSSYISVYPNSTSSNDVNCTLYAEDTGDAADFVTNPHIINETFRPRTTASTSWIEDDVTVGTYVNSPSLNAPLQELLNRPDWAPGNSLAILMIAHEDVNKEVRFWEQEKYLNLPVQLFIEYSESGP